MKNNLKLDEHGQLCFYNDEYVNLSNNEFKLMHYLAERPNKMVSYDEIREHVLIDATNNHINTMMSRIRSKLPGIEVKTKSKFGYGYIQ